LTTFVQSKKLGLTKYTIFLSIDVYQSLITSLDQKMLFYLYITFQYIKLLIYS